MARGLILALCAGSRAAFGDLRLQQHAADPGSPALADKIAAKGDHDMDRAGDALVNDGQVITGASLARVPTSAEAITPRMDELDELDSFFGTNLHQAVDSAKKHIHSEVNRGVKEAVNKAIGKDFGKKDLAFVHIPATFGHTVERVALSGARGAELPGLYRPSFLAKKEENQWRAIKIAKGPGGEIWGRMFPELRAISNVTGCNLYHTPQKLWPKDLAEQYFGGKRAFTILRDPYDRIVAEFRDQAADSSSDIDPGRSAISEREGSKERESEEYLGFYSSCDVNSWVKAELALVLQGDRNRGNCHLLPQADYFENQHGISLAIDNRLIPESFNEIMEEHGYPISMDASTITHNRGCTKLSAWSLDEEARALVQAVYARDFKLLCRTFGYCDNEELTCLQQLPNMCGGSPYERPNSHFRRAV